jgi:hypothetical protein
LAAVGHILRKQRVINVCLNCHMGTVDNSTFTWVRLSTESPYEERAEWVIAMNTVLYFSASGVAYETRAYTPADITQLIQNQRLQCLTSADRQFDFWFAPTSRRCQRRVNRTATELLLATTSFTARTVPLLRGSIVLASHDAEGDLDGLSWVQLDRLTRLNRTVTDRDRRILGRRMARDERRLRREVTANTRRVPASSTKVIGHGAVGVSAPERRTPAMHR